jgi:hypothetical protein
MFNHSATEKTDLPNQTLSASGIPNGLLKAASAATTSGPVSVPDIGEQSGVV